MSEIQYFYLDGRVRDRNYDELTDTDSHGKKKWNQASLRGMAEPLRSSKIGCRCRGDGQAILMHVVEKLEWVVAGSNYFAANSKQSGWKIQLVVSVWQSKNS